MVLVLPASAAWIAAGGKTAGPSASLRMTHSCQAREFQIPQLRYAPVGMTSHQLNNGNRRLTEDQGRCSATTGEPSRIVMRISFHESGGYTTVEWHS